MTTDMTFSALCRRRSWQDPTYECYHDSSGYTCLVVVNNREFRTDLAYDSDALAKENAAMRAFMVCRNLSVNGGMLPVAIGGKHSRSKKSRHHSSSSGYREHRSHGSHRSGHSPSSSTGSLEYGSENESMSTGSRLKGVSIDEDSGHASISTGSHFKTLDNSPVSLRFAAAIDSRNATAITHFLVESFDEIACGSFSWTDELRQLGLSMKDIADELVEQTSESPWIFSIFAVPSSPLFENHFHIENCCCPDRHGKSIEGSSSVPMSEAKRSLPFNEYPFEGPVEDVIDILCGIGGVRPSGNDDRTLAFGFVDLHGELSRASILYHTQSSLDTLTNVLDNLSVAAGILQKVGGCCNKLTYLSIEDSATAVQLHTLDLQVIHDLKSHIASPTLDNIAKLIPGFSFADGENDGISATLLLSIVVQFLSTAFLSYSRAHCGPIRPAFFDRAVDQIILLGAAERIHDYDGPCISGSLVNLACFGDMLGRPTVAFRYFNRLSQAESTTISEEKHDLVASPCDLLDTWGPGQLISSSDDHKILHAVYLGGGSITATAQDSGRALLHWSRRPRLEKLPSMTFSRSQKAVIGAQIHVNANCMARQQNPFHSASTFFHEIGTYRDYWESAERQLGFGLQAGQYSVATLQLSQTWMKMKGMTKKSRMLAQLYKSDLEELYSVQVSICTGVARRVSLRKMLADLLPTYVAALFIEPPLWKSLVKDFEIITALEGGNLDQ